MATSSKWRIAGWLSLAAMSSSNVSPTSPRQIRTGDGGLTTDCEPPKDLMTRRDCLDCCLACSTGCHAVPVPSLLMVLEGTGAPNAIPARHAQLNEPNGTPARTRRHHRPKRNLSGPFPPWAAEADSGGRKVEFNAVSARFSSAPYRIVADHCQTKKGPCKHQHNDRCRVDEDVTTLAPHRSGRADFQHPVPHRRASFHLV